MKKLNATLLCAILMLCIQQSSFATIRRVNKLSDYNGSNLWGTDVGGTAAKPVYKEINEAILATPLGLADTIHVEGADASYDGFIIPTGKPVVIIGAGYFLTENGETSNNLLSTKVSNTSSISAVGARVQGIHFNSNSLTVNASEVVIERCRFDNLLTLGGYSQTDIIIRRNYFANTTNNITNSGSASNYPSGTIITNNIFKGKVNFSNPASITIQKFSNNVLDPDGTNNVAAYTMVATEFKNNIYKNPNLTLAITSLNITHNIIPAAIPGWDATNLVLNVGVQTSSVFVDQNTNSTDGDFQLKPAYANGNFGSDGTQRGVFGGTTCYELSGIGPIPVVYNVIVPNTVTPNTGLQVTISSQVVD